MKAHLFALALSTIVATVATNALAAEIKSATVDPQAATLTLVVKSKQYCNRPQFDIVFEHSGRAAFGPYHFQLQETPVTKMNCRGSQEMTLVFGLEKIAQCSASWRVVYIKGDNESTANLQLNRPQPE